MTKKSQTLEADKQALQAQVTAAEQEKLAVQKRLEESEQRIAQRTSDMRELKRELDV